MRFLLLFLLTFQASCFASFDWSDYSALLSQHVKAGEKSGVQSNLIDYQGFTDDPRYQKTLESLAAFNPDALTGDEKKNFYINAYNIMAIKVVVDHGVKKSIKDAGSWFAPVWQKPAGIINGKSVTLDQIEHKILRKLGDPRIHFAIVCASMSCPDLRPEAYKIEKLDKQLEEQTHAFLSNASKGMVIKDNQIYISKIFDWFDEDFDIKSQGDKGVLQFIASYQIEAGRFSNFKTIDYNWALNKP